MIHQCFVLFCKYMYCLENVEKGLQSGVYFDSKGMYNKKIIIVIQFSYVLFLWTSPMNTTQIYD